MKSTCSYISGILRQPITKFGLVILLAVATLAFILASWTCDDAFITFRVVENAIHGYGLRWNVEERVQVATHPLWLFLLIGGTAIFRNVALASVLAGIFFSAATLLLIIKRHTKNAMQAVLVTMLFLASKASIDYTTSGLENALSHCCLVLFLSELYPTQGRPVSAIRASFFAALLMLNRLDLSLLAMPALAWIWVGSFKRNTLRTTFALVFGMVPLIAWLVFSLIYYGFPFPNTAYAKLGTGIPSGVLFSHGFHYFMNSLRYDPLTLLVISSISAIAFRRGTSFDRAVAVGMMLYFAYVFKIGGCFMAGRFMTAALVASLVLLPRLVTFDPKSFLISLAAIVASFAWTYWPMVRWAVFQGEHFPLMMPHDIHDEHACFHPFTGTLRRFTHPRVGIHPWVEEGLDARRKADAGERVVIVEDNIGFAGFYAGPKPYFVDPAALSDPLLARLPQSGMWKIGHFYRPIPEGYLETLQTGTNVIRDPKIAQLYDELGVVTRGELFTSERWRLIRKLNFDGVKPELRPAP